VPQVKALALAVVVSGHMFARYPTVVDERQSLEQALAGRYVIERELGHGGSASVYLARDLKVRRLVALKVLTPELALAVRVERFRREIAIAARLNHPHILPLFEADEAGGFFFYTMPPVQGESLGARLSRVGRLPLDEALGIAGQVAEALEYAHSQGVIHRDIKPGNMLLDPGGHVWVADFGIARAIVGEVSEPLTETGSAMGTVAYMSPEQISGAVRLDGHTDIYSLGCVLYEMLAGAPPYTGPTAQSVLAKQLVDPVPPIGRPDVPGGVARIIERAWRANPHPDLAAAYAKLRPGDSARQRLSRVEALAAKGPPDAEAALAVARAALDAQEFVAARSALAPYTASPRKRVAALMAELEMAQGDEGRAREWMARALNARRDPAWTADAFVSDHWLPISPVSGRLDAFEWKDPLAGEDHGTVIEHRAEAPAPAAAPAVLSAKDADAKALGAAGPPRAESSQPAPHPQPLPASGESERAQRAAEEGAHPAPFSAGGRSERRAMAAATADESRVPRAREMTPVAPAVIPLVPPPDDPGPNGEMEVEPTPELPPPPDGWSRIRALFRP